MKKHYSICRLGLSFCLATLLAGCHVQQGPKLTSGQVVAKRSSVTATAYLQQAKDAPSEERATLLLQAVGTLLAAGNKTEAARLMKNLSGQPLTQESATQLQLLQAKLNLEQNHPGTAKWILLGLKTDGVDDPAAINRSRDQLLVQVYQAEGRWLLGIQAQAKLIGELDEGEEKSNRVLTLWNQLSSQPVLRLHQWLAQVPDQSASAGWLNLAIIMQEDRLASRNWFNDLAKWQQEFPQHAAASLIPKAPKLAEIVDKKTDGPRKIVLLLPLTGPHAKQGEAIRRGFYAAYFNQRQQAGAQTTRVQVYDTNQVSMGILLNRIREQHITAVVGPLLKKNVQELLAKPALGVPVLALNAANQTQKDVIQFSLSPEASMDQLTAGIAAAKRWRVAVLAPSSALGDRSLERLRSDWGYYHGDLVGVFRYGKASTYAAGIRELLNINQAVARKQQLRRAINKKFRFVAHGRKDIDAFVLIGNRMAAQSLRPLLDFYFAGKVPVYSTAQLVKGLRQSKHSTDLNGIQFLAAPWLVAPANRLPRRNAVIRSELQKTWPNSTRKNALLYAMGVDAYFVMGRFQMLRSVPNSSYFGETGVLTVDSNGRIFPRLLWAQFQRGKVKLLNKHG